MERLHDAVSAVNAAQRNDTGTPQDMERLWQSAWSLYSIAYSQWMARTLKTMSDNIDAAYDKHVKKQHLDE